MVLSNLNVLFYFDFYFDFIDKYYFFKMNFVELFLTDLFETDFFLSKRNYWKFFLYAHNILHIF